MPYITPEDRKELLDFNVRPGLFATCTREEIGLMMGLACRNGGDLQYMLAVALQKYMETKGLRYANCEDVMGALSGALREFQRCVVDPYEQQKLSDNGEVYDTEKMKNGKY